MMLAISSTAPSLPATFARRCRASSRCRPQMRNCARGTLSLNGSLFCGGLRLQAAFFDCLQFCCGTSRW